MTSLRTGLSSYGNITGGGSSGGGNNPFKQARVATTAALAANTYDNGSAGVGATLTANANGSINPIDGENLIVGDRILVKNEAAQANNGIYTVTVVGTAGTPYVLTRATDFDTSAEMQPGTVVTIAEGTANGDKAFLLTSDTPITVGTTAITFSEFGAGMAIGSAVSGGTTGSVLFVGAGPVLAQDNANFFWDDTNNRLGLMTAAPTHTMTHGSTSTGTAWYNTADQVTNYERLLLSIVSNQYVFDSQVGGSGTRRNIVFQNLGAGNTSFTISASSSQSFQFSRGSTSTAGINVMDVDITSTATSGTFSILSITPVYNQAASTATNTDLLINRTETAVGSGNQRLIDAQVGGSSRFRVTNTGAVVSVADILAGASSMLGWNGRSMMASPSDGVINLTNTAGNDFSRLQFGGTTSSFPSLKRSTTTLQARLADDSAGAALYARAHPLDTTNGTINAQTGTSYTNLNTDNGGVVTLSNGAGITVTITDVGMDTNYSTTFYQIGAGQVTFTAGGTAVLRQRSGFTKTAGQWAAVTVQRVAGGTDFILSGDMAA